MDTINSFKGYGKVDPIEEKAFRRKTRKRLIILIASSVVLVAAVIGAVVGTVLHTRNSNSKEVPSTPTTPAASLKAVCSVTEYPDSCYSSIQTLEAANATTDPEEIFKLSLRVVSNELSKVSPFFQTLMSKTDNEKEKAALGICETMIDDASDRLNDSISSVGEKFSWAKRMEDLKTWLSAALTDLETCFDALDEANSTVVLEEVRGVMKNSTEFGSNSLAIVAKVLGILGKVPMHRKLLGISDFPEWLYAGDRRLLQEATLTPNLTVAKDGSGDFRTIQEAVNKVPKKSTSRFVIYVKAGVYVENVNLDKSVWNVMMYGDGKALTVVSGSRNSVDGTPTFSTATFVAVGRGFIARDMGFKNTAGAEKHQAVALRSGSDQSVFYRCSFDAFQDTLYTHSNRQFYRDCDVTGTIDFIFGNSAVVIQNCNIMPRQPLPNQFVTITAQGKKDVNQNTGISIHKCFISPLDSLTVPTYLGRPWKDFSTTVIMQTVIGSFLQPSGWAPWDRNVVPPKTIFYAEYQNTGPGSSVDKRVTWPGYRPSITAAQASKFTVQSFIGGSDWLPPTNVAFDSSL
ncbi:Pectinesterase [Actinidia chinensis var. chinensis]|uniref:Pectinesterase n=1 Tax=Actinidia chinensis var. chinensis TaxID=1590841 RepID=A0A2R6R0I5_ACTCC|nr:Pectinesterase [Actinidia chinensis var. chinensis]